MVISTFFNEIIILTAAVNQILIFTFTILSFPDLHFRGSPLAN